MEIYFLKRALADQLREAEFWYEQSPELESEFLEALDVAIQTICLSPNGYARASTVRPSEVRRFYEKRFHTNIFTVVFNRVKGIKNPKVAPSSCKNFCNHQY